MVGRLSQERKKRPFAIQVKLRDRSIAAEWRRFAKAKGFSSTSQLIRDSVQKRITTDVVEKMESRILDKLEALRCDIAELRREERL